MIAAGNTTPHGRLWSVVFAGWLCCFLRDYEQAEARAAQALERCEQYQLPFYAASNRVLLGIVRSQLGRAAEGIALIRRGIAELLELGTGQAIGSMTAQLAAALGRKGATDEALETVEQALRANPEELVYRPEILWIRGELQLKQGQTELAEVDFREAIALARKMGAKAWELRVSLSLARLLKLRSQRDTARTLLAQIYNCFTEGFDTADLKEAKALLDELSVS
jgi:tetratricopeptide (TPR) repeat protein